MLTAFDVMATYLGGETLGKRYHRSNDAPHNHTHRSASVDRGNLRQTGYPSIRSNGSTLTEAQALVIRINCRCGCGRRTMIGKGDTTATSGCQIGSVVQRLSPLTRVKQRSWESSLTPLSMTNNNMTAGLHSWYLLLIPFFTLFKSHS